MFDTFKQFDYKKFLKLVAEKLSLYRTALTAVVLCGVFAFAIIRIDMLSNPPANESRLDEQTSVLRKVNFDQEVIDQIQDLVDSGITIDAEFDPNRDNPFTN